MLADIPGLIEGAHEGAGLGDRFLGHVERCAVLLHLVDGASEDVAGAWRTVRGELDAYGHDLDAKTELIALNKCDALTDEEIAIRKKTLEDASSKQVLAISGVSGTGVTEALRQLWVEVRAQREAAVPVEIKAFAP